MKRSIVGGLRSLLYTQDHPLVAPRGARVDTCEVECMPKPHVQLSSVSRDYYFGRADMPLSGVAQQWKSRRTNGGPTTMTSPEAVCTGRSPTPPFPRTALGCEISLRRGATCRRAQSQSHFHCRASAAAPRRLRFHTSVRAFDSQTWHSVPFAPSAQLTVVPPPIGRTNPFVYTGTNPVHSSPTFPRPKKTLGPLFGC